MTKFVVDCAAVLHLVAEEIEVPAEHELLAPTLLRSQTLSVLHEAAHRGDLESEVAFDRLTRIRAIPIRLLGDAVLRRRAWQLADQLGWAETYDAEYLALTQLQADAFVTLDPELARRVEGRSPWSSTEGSSGSEGPPRSRAPRATVRACGNGRPRHLHAHHPGRLVELEPRRRAGRRDLV